MKVFVYKRQMKRGQKRERVAILNEVFHLVESKSSFYISYPDGNKLEYNKKDYIISVFGW